MRGSLERIDGLLEERAMAKATSTTSVGERKWEPQPSEEARSSKKPKPLKAAAVKGDHLKERKKRGHCFVCGKEGHIASKCRYKTSGAEAKGKAGDEARVLLSKARRLRENLGEEVDQKRFNPEASLDKRSMRVKALLSLPSSVVSEKSPLDSSGSDDSHVSRALKFFRDGEIVAKRETNGRTS